MIPKPFKYHTSKDKVWCVEVCGCKTKTVNNMTKIGSTSCKACVNFISKDYTQGTVTCTKLRYRSKKTGKAVFLKN